MQDVLEKGTETVDVFAGRPCPEWCRWKAGHTYDSMRDTGPERTHEGPHFGEHVVIYAEEHAYKGGPVDPPVVTVSMGDEMVDLAPAQAAELAVNLTKAHAWVAALANPLPWWRTAPNPECRSWCTVEHAPDEFANGGLMLCTATVAIDATIVEQVEVCADVMADEGPAATDGALIWGAPTIEVSMVRDGRDGYVFTPKGLEDAMSVLPAALAEARRIVASDPHATDEQRAAVTA